MREMVVLVSGLGLGGAEMALLARRLKRRGYCTRVFWHFPWRHSLSEKAALLHRFVAALDGNAVHFVAHSFGGLLVLRLFNDYPDQRPGRIVMLGVPVEGSRAACIVGKCPLGRLLLGGYVTSDSARAEGKLLPGREVGGIAGKVNLVVGWLFGLARPNDTLVSAEEALHEGMQDTVVLAVSHSSMLLSGRVVRCVDSFLKTGAFAGCSTKEDARIMNRNARRVVPVLGALLAIGSPALAPKTAFPVAVSENKRYFVDSNGDPVFWLGTTQWQLFREYTLDEARTILERTAANGFKFVQVMLMGVGDGTAPNVHSQKPWINDDPLTPNEEYFKNVDAVLKIAGDNNLAISMTLYHQRYRQRITLEKARPWARWLAQRYKDVPHIVWSMTPQAKDEFVPVLRELAAGLREGDGGRHLITFKPDPSPYTSSFIHGEPWLDFNSMQTWRDVRLIYPMVTKDYNMVPVKPVLMAEGAYEAGTEYGFDVTPLWIRRQAYYSYLAGAHHTYGHNDSWRVLPTWKQALDAPGAVQMGILKRIFMARREWWLLVPDQSVFASGGQTEGDLLHLAARHRDGKWAMVYLAEKASFAVNMDKVAGAGVNALWVNPKTGDAVAAGSFPNSDQRSFSTPDGWEDALLILEAVEGSASSGR